MRRVAVLLAVVAAGAIAADAQRAPAMDGVMPSRIYTPPPPVAIPDGPGRISGRVLDRDRQTPVDRAQVFIEYLAPGTGVRRAIASRIVATGTDGEFVARDLASGRSNRNRQRAPSPSSLLACVGRPRAPTPTTRCARPAARGRRRFDGLTPGRFLISMPAFRNWRVRSIAIGGIESLHQAFDLSADIDWLS